MQSTYQPTLFLASAPRRPYCTDELGDRLRIRSQAEALGHRYIQHNPPAALAFLVFDFDRHGALVAAGDAGLPEPSWVAENPATRRGHLAYALACPVITSDAARAAPLRYAASVEQGYRDALRADAGYSNFLTKTPGHEAWSTRWGRADAYTLEELAEYLPNGLPKVRKRREEASGLGRNVSLFESVRHWAYRARWNYGDANEWHAAVLRQALSVNSEFTNPLMANEAASTAKSIAKWVWQRFSMAEFSRIQSARGKRRGIQKSSERMDLFQQILEFNK